MADRSDLGRMADRATSAAQSACGMPRLPRFFVPGVPLHVIQRGNDRQPTFLDADDLTCFRNRLLDACRRHTVSVHSYVLMANHFHLLVTPDDPAGVPRTMQAVGRVYVQWFNRRHRRTGTLWEGRYKAAIVDDERYLITCMRYIELNPVRARIVDHPRAYRWSSFAANAFGDTDELLTPHPVYHALGSSDDARQAAYRDLFRAAIPLAELDLIRDATQHAWALGRAGFLARVDASGRRPSRLPRGGARRSAPNINRV